MRNSNFDSGFIFLDWDCNWHRDSQLVLWEASKHLKDNFVRKEISLNWGQISRSEYTTQALDRKIEKNIGGEIKNYNKIQSNLQLKIEIALGKQNETLIVGKKQTIALTEDNNRTTNRNQMLEITIKSHNILSKIPTITEKMEQCRNHSNSQKSKWRRH